MIAQTGTVGEFDPTQGRLTFDGVAGSRTNEGPTFDIANGAPTGVGAPDTLLLGWLDGRLGLNHERSMLRYSTDGGDSGAMSSTSLKPAIVPTSPGSRSLPTATTST